MTFDEILATIDANRAGLETFDGMLGTGDIVPPSVEDIDAGTTATGRAIDRVALQQIDKQWAVLRDITEKVKAQHDPAE